MKLKYIKEDRIDRGRNKREKIDLGNVHDKSSHILLYITQDINASKNIDPPSTWNETKEGYIKQDELFRPKCINIMSQLRGVIN